MKVHLIESCQLENSKLQGSHNGEETGGQLYNDNSPLSVPCLSQARGYYDLH